MHGENISNLVWDLLFRQLKSKAWPEERRTIPNRKWAGLFAIVVTLTVCGARTDAQQPAKIPRIGFLSGRVNPSSATPDASADAFRQGLRDLGYIEGKNILVEYRYADAKEDRIPSLVAELVQLNVDVLRSPHAPAGRTAKQATKPIPIGMAANQDQAAT